MLTSCNDLSLATNTTCVSNNNGDVNKDEMGNSDKSGDHMEEHKNRGKMDHSKEVTEEITNGNTVIVVNKMNVKEKRNGTTRKERKQNDNMLKNTAR